jgi:hypothetical protein
MNCQQVGYTLVLLQHQETDGEMGIESAVPRLRRYLVNLESTCFMQRSINTHWLAQFYLPSTKID